MRERVSLKEPDGEFIETCPEKFADFDGREFVLKLMGIAPMV